MNRDDWARWDALRRTVENLHALPKAPTPQPPVEPRGLYFSGLFVMCRSTNGNPEVICKMTYQDFFFVSRGLAIP